MHSANYLCKHPALTISQILQPPRPGQAGRPFQYFPVDVPGEANPLRAPPIEADVEERYGFGLLNLEQSVVYNNAFGTYLHDVHIAEGTFTLDEGLTRAFLVTGVPLQFRSSIITRHYTVSSTHRLNIFAQC